MMSFLFFFDNDDNTSVYIVLCVYRCVCLSIQIHSHPFDQSIYVASEAQKSHLQSHLFPLPYLPTVYCLCEAIPPCVVDDDDAEGALVVIVAVLHIKGLVLSSVII